MKKTKKIISLLLSVLMIITALPLTAVNSFAADEITSGVTGDCIWSLDGTVLTISGNGKMEDYDYFEKKPWGTLITKAIIENGVTSIGGEAFKDCTSLTSITIPDGVTEIGMGAFYNCTSLTSVTIPDSVTEIGWYAFEDCTSLTSVTIPDGVTSIGGSTFSGCTSLTSITIPDSVTEIGANAFLGCTSLASITIPNSVTYIDKEVFYGCTSLAEINVGSDNANYSSENGVLFNKAKTVLIKYPAGKTNTEYVIPNSVYGIREEVFENCTSLTSITIPDSVTIIAVGAFYGCESLTEISVSSENADYSSENGVLFNKDKTKIVRYPVGKKDLSYSIPDSVTSIGEEAFRYCALLTSVTIPDGVTSIGEGAFGDCTSLTSVIIPDSVTEIGYSGFCGCTSLTSVTIGSGVTSIGGHVFYGCTSLTSITIPDSVTSIGYDAFGGCTSLTNIIIPDGTTEISSSSFEDTAYYNNTSNWDNGILYIGNHLIKAKKDVFDHVKIKQGTKTIADSAFQTCSSLTSVTIPDSVTSIGGFAFEYCTSLKSVTIPDSVTGINESTFENCKALTKVTIGNSVTSIGGHAFYDCTSLTSITIPENVKTISEYAFNHYKDFIIYGYAGSEAERYANKNGFKFVAIGDAPTMTFPDVRSGDWYSDAVKYNFERGYITGYSNGTFGPANNIQRQDFVLILARIAGADLSAYEGQNGGFSDVQAGTYYASAVAWAKDKGVVNGYSSDNFGVGTYISREQICIIFSRYLNGSASGDVDSIINAYSDGGNTSPWAKAGVAWAIENGIIGNAGYINPIGNAGRAEVAQIIYNMANNGIL